MGGLSSDAATERAVAMYQCIVNLGGVSEQEAVTVGEIVDSQFFPVPEPDGGWPSREAQTMAATSWLRTAVRLGYVADGKPPGRRGGRWYYWARSA
jgi:hypothetical protein